MPRGAVIGRARGHTTDGPLSLALPSPGVNAHGLNTILYEWRALCLRRDFNRLRVGLPFKFGKLASHRGSCYQRCTYVFSTNANLLIIGMWAAYVSAHLIGFSYRQLKKLPHIEVSLESVPILFHSHNIMRHVQLTKTSRRLAQGSNSGA